MTVELWQTAQKWLVANGNDVDKKYCKQEITTHPSYPRLISLIDFLELGNLSYQAVQADHSFIHEFRYPLLAHIDEPGHQYMYTINTPADWEKQQHVTQYWSGIVVYADEGSKWDNKNNSIYKKKATVNFVIRLLLLFLGIIAFSFSANHSANLAFNIFGALSLAGLAISIAVLGAELGFQSQIVKQFCGVVNKEGGCEQVLKSRYAKGIAEISPADASVVYFSTQFFLYLLGCWYSSLLQTIMLIAFTGIIVAAWSLYTQAIKLKKWCVLCLGIVAVLIAQAAIGFTQTFTEVGFSEMSAFIFAFMSFGIILLPIKNLIKINNTNQAKIAELRKWKFDVGLFQTQLNEEAAVDTAVWTNDLLLGEPDAPILITVACSPYCGPCAQTHVELEALLDRYPGKLKLQLRMLSGDNQGHSQINIASREILQQAAFAQNNDEIRALINDWFAWRNYDKWKLKWNRTDAATDSIEVMNVSERLAWHKKWMDESNITYTPTMFINGRRIPGRYSLEDIELLIPQLLETFKSTMAIGQ